MPRKVNNDVVFCKEHSKFEGAYYYKNIAALIINSHTQELELEDGTLAEIGVFDGWELVTAPGTKYTGKTQKDLMNTLKKLWPTVCWHQKTKNTRDKVVIFTDCLAKVEGFFEDYITEQFGKYYVVLKSFFDIRPCDRWIDLKHVEGDMCEYIRERMQVVVDTYFIPAKYFFITPQQRQRKHIAKAKKLTGDKSADVSFPESYNIWKQNRHGYHAGLLYCPYTESPITEKMLVLDITSSYIYDLLCCKFPMSESRSVSTNMWEYYLTSETKGSLGLYEISYSCPFNHIKCFKDMDGNHLEKGSHTVKMMLTDIDMNNLFKLGYIKEVECIWLHEFDLDYLPRYFVENVAQAYIDKATAKDDAEKDLRKPLLNANTGDPARKFETEDAFEDERKNPNVSPMWGIWMMSYSKMCLLELALSVTGWYYSDTDSIICLDTKENRQKRIEFNEKIGKNVRAFCERYGYEFAPFEKLGTFKIEAEPEKLRVWKTKTYCYGWIDKETGKWKVVLKAAGLVQGGIEVNEKLFRLKEIDYTRTTFPIIVPKKISKDLYNIDGGFYVEITPKHKAQYYALIQLFMKNHANFCVTE